MVVILTTYKSWDDPPSTPPLFKYTFWYHLYSVNLVQDFKYPDWIWSCVGMCWTQFFVLSAKTNLDLARKTIDKTWVFSFSQENMAPQKFGSINTFPVHFHVRPSWRPGPTVSPNVDHCRHTSLPNLVVTGTGNIAWRWVLNPIYSGKSKFTLSMPRFPPKKQPALLQGDYHTTMDKIIWPSF